MPACNESMVIISYLHIFLILVSAGEFILVFLIRNSDDVVASEKFGLFSCRAATAALSYSWFYEN
jgi:hypothetical protein